MGELPPLVVELVEVLGIAETMRICRDCGGVRFIVPLNPPQNDDHKMVALLGRAVADKIVEAMGGNSVTVLMLSGLNRILMDNAIRAEYDAGATLPALALTYRMSDRRLHIILSESKATSPRRSASIVVCSYSHR